MGKRNRKQKKEVTSSEANAAPVPDKSPKICEEKPNFSEFKVGEIVHKPSRSPVKDDKSSKITSYFPRSPEGRLQPAPPPTEASVAATEKGESLALTAHLPPLGLLTPDTTPTKEISQPPPRPTHHTDPTPPHHRPAETQETRGEPADRPKAAQKLEYGVAASREATRVGGGSAEGKMGGAKVNEGVAKTEEGKSSRRGKGRSRKSKQAKQVQSPSMTLKDYFPVRRSNRRCKSAIEAEETKRLHEAVLTGQEEGVEVQDIVGKGRGVIATRTFKKGDFVVEYHGDHIDIGTAREREQEYAANPGIGCYMYYYQYKNKSFCVDATAESGRIGRLLNHSKSGNCTTKLISVDDRPYLILVAAKPISIGEELLYDYGDRNKESLQSHPWLAL